MVCHRPIEGTPKTVTIRRRATGKWYATITCECSLSALEPSNKQVGIDVGLNYFTVLDTEEKIQNPGFFRTEEKTLTKAHRQLSQAEKGT